MSGMRIWLTAASAIVIACICSTAGAQDFGEINMGGEGMIEPTPPTTIAEWNRQIEQVESGQPTDPMGMLVAMTIESYRQAHPTLSSNLRAAISSGSELNNEQVNQIANAIGRAMAQKMAAELGVSADQLTAEQEPIEPGSEDEQSLKAFVAAMAPRMGDMGSAPGPAPTDAASAMPSSTRPEVKDQATEYWKDFIHYSRLARLDLAAANGQSFIDAPVDPETVLAIVEDSPYARNYEKDLVRMQNMDSEQAEQTNIARIAAAAEQKIDQSLIAVVRNPVRIRQEIRKLDDGLRARMNATRRLQIAGEYATPYMLEVLSGAGAEDEKLRPYVVEAMVEIGRPVVVPAAEAMKAMGPVARQDVARVLRRIGYPVALPYLKALAESEQTDDDTRAALLEAFDDIARNRGINRELSAASLFYMLAEDYYAGRESLILAPADVYNVMWYVDDSGRLSYRRVPTVVYGDVMAMQAARRALKHEPSMSSAMSLWVAANFRRENNLPEGMTDPSYGPDMRSPHFYAVLAGPAHITPAMGRALDDRDPALTRDLIKALEATAGSMSLADHADAVVAALTAPDRRVRYEMAMAVAKADPNTLFDGAGRVVPVLSEAVRQGERQVAVVLAGNQDQVNLLASSVRDAGDFEVLMARTMDEVAAAVADVPGVDLIVGQVDVNGASQLITARRNNYKLLGAPMVVVSAAGQTTELNRMFANDNAVVVVRGGEDQDEIDAAIDQALAVMDRGQITPDEATNYATAALDMLHDLSVDGSTAFDVSLAQSAMIGALDDPRDEVAGRAAKVLATLDNTEAQQAIAATALDDGRPTSLRVVMLDELARSARNYGNQLDARQTGALLDLVSSASGDLADAAARAHGALDLPTSHGIELILE